MERVFLLQHNQPFTVEAIQQILEKKISLTFSPDLYENLYSDSLTKEEVITPAELQATAIGLDPETPAELTPLMLLLLANFFAKNSFIGSAQIVARVLEFHDFEIFPQVFSQGLYASPTAHLLLPVFGAGKVYYQGYLLNAADVHDIFSWHPLSWPNTLPRALTTASFMGISNLIYCFIQFKKIAGYSQELLSATAIIPDSGSFFQDQIEDLVTQLNHYLAFPEGQTKNLNGFVYQVEKLISKFGEHTFENITNLANRSDISFTLNKHVSLNTSHLLALLEILSQENSILFGSNSNPNSAQGTDNSKRLNLQPFLFLKNLEKIWAVVTLIQLLPAINPENKVNETADLSAAYRNQVIDVIKEANFDELIRKTIAFMYARVASK